MLWSINTTPNRSIGYTPFFMVYGAEAVLPSDICHDSSRVAAYVEANNEQARQDALDLLDEERDLAAARSAIYQQDLRRYHSRRVKSRTFQEGDLVLWLIQDLSDAHKLSPRGALALSPIVWGYVGLYRRKKYVGGHPRGPRDRGRAL